MYFCGHWACLRGQLTNGSALKRPCHTSILLLFQPRFHLRADPKMDPAVLCTLRASIKPAPSSARFPSHACIEVSVRNSYDPYYSVVGPWYMGSKGGHRVLHRESVVTPTYQRSC